MDSSHFLHVFIEENVINILADLYIIHFTY